MTAGSVITVILLLLCMAGAVFLTVRARKRHGGGCGCGGNCAACGGCRPSSTPKEEKQNKK